MIGMQSYASDGNFLPLHSQAAFRKWCSEALQFKQMDVEPQKSEAVALRNERRAEPGLEPSDFSAAPKHRARPALFRKSRIGPRFESWCAHQSFQALSANGVGPEREQSRKFATFIFRSY